MFRIQTEVTRTMRRMAVAAMAALVMLVGATAAYAHAPGNSEVKHDRGRRELREVQKVTVKYHRLSKALDDGFVAFSLEGTDVPTCFDSPDGGMGVHYVRNIDGVVDAKDPEALVYEVGKHGRLRLVAVEYIIPEEFVEDSAGNVVALPELFGQEFHKHSFLPVYILHAWIWKWNPDGKFADFNPRVRACPNP
jgi:hypothetical protein